MFNVTRCPEQPHIFHFVREATAPIADRWVRMCLSTSWEATLTFLDCNIARVCTSTMATYWILLRGSFVIFPECVARVPVSLWGSGGWGCSLDVTQPSATVRKPRMVYGKFCKRGRFWRFQTSRCFVSHGRRCTSWHSDVFCNVPKVVVCGRRNTCATFA